MPRLSDEHLLTRLATLILISAVVSFTAGCSGNEPLPPVKPLVHERVLNDRDVIGCCELLSLAWTPPLSEEWRRFYAPPRYFALTSDVLGDPKVRRVKARELDYQLRMGGWRVSNKNEVEAGTAAQLSASCP